jgi:hypothetical protein
MLSSDEGPGDWCVLSQQPLLNDVQGQHQRLGGHVALNFSSTRWWCVAAQMEKSLYLLVTDIGFRDQPSIVWERLDEVKAPLI